MQSISYPDGLIETRLYTGDALKPMYEAMDADLKAAEAKGGQLRHRGKIGRNAACPCGSGTKFKKCRMPNARRINTR